MRPTAGEGGGAEPVRLLIPVLVALGLGLAARLVHVAVAAAHPETFVGLFLDSRYYADVARTIRAGAGAGDHPYLLSPLYPYFLALFPFVEGDPHQAPALAARVVQAVLGAGTAALVAWLAGRTGGRRAAWIGGIVAAVYGPTLHFDTAILVGGPQAFFLTGAVALLVLAEGREGRSRTAALTGAGLALGLGAALRPTLLVVATALALALFLRGGRARGARSALALAAGLALAIAPFTVRNLAVGGEPVLLTAGGGFNFWVGNHAGASGLFQAPPSYDPQRDPLARSAAEQEAGLELSHAQASAHWRGEALRDVAQDPGGWLALLADKLVLFLHPVEIPQLGQSYEWHAKRLWTLRVHGFPPLDGRWILILAFLAPLVLFARDGRKGLARTLVPGVALWSYAAIVVLFFVNGRYRVPAMPLAIALGASSLGALTELLGRRREWARPGAVAGSLALFAALGTGSTWLYREAGAYAIQGSTGAEERQRAMRLLREGRPEEAIRLLEQALAERDNGSTRLNLALALKMTGKPREALEEVLRVQRREPENATALSLLGDILYEDLRDARGAEEAYRAALELDPRMAEVEFNLSVVLWQRGELEEASGRMEHALQTAPREAPWRVHGEKALLELRQTLAARRLEGDGR